MNFARKIWPKTLAGQILLVVALALALAQILNIFLLLGEKQLASLSARMTLAERLCTAAAFDIARTDPPPSQPDLRQLATPQMTFFRTRDGLPARAALTDDPKLADRVRGLFARENIPLMGIEAGTRQQRPNQRGPQGAYRADETFIAFRFQAAGPWFVCHVASEAPEKFLTLRLIAGTLGLFVIVLGITHLVTRRIIRPLTNLSSAVTQFGKNGERSGPIATDGPAEISAVATALNDMNERISALLEEKDAMLGAIGHDLRTPLTALRIRAENLAPSEETRRMIVLIDHLAHMLNAVIGLAKVGHDPEAPVLTDVTALATAIVEEFEDLGVDVTLQTAAPVVHALRPHLFMQLLRNLADNGAKYGERARISLQHDGDMLIMRIEDDGPGIDPADAERLMKPFERLETSRNRETGGTGLGLAIARIIAGMHEAEIEFVKIGGAPFAAVVRVPVPGTR